jgi:predicted TIM-barrel fold metal-dependent hydrolase
VDSNVTLGRWPFRRLPLDDTSALVSKLRKQGVTQAWAGSFEGLLHRDIVSVNEQLADECRRHGRGLLVPFGSVNLKMPDWEEELRRCHEHYKMPGIRLHPNYHGYKLDEPVFARLLHLARERGLIVQIAVSMEDERMQHSLVRVPDVDLSPLPALIKNSPAPQLVLLNWFRAMKGDVLKKLAEMGNVWFDIAMVEGVGGTANLLKQVQESCVVFGSHAPFFYYEAALLKLKESALSDEQSRAICRDNARRVLLHF